MLSTGSLHKNTPTCGTTSSGWPSPLARLAAFHDKHNPLAVLQRDHAGLKAHCEGLELLPQTYATVINELTLQNEALRAQTGSTTTTVTPFPRRHPGRPTL
jgi:hypothetical protein